MFNHDKGYGFIVPDAGRQREPDVFLHVSEIQKSGINPHDIFETRKISYDLQDDSRRAGKKIAANIKIIG